MLTFVWRSQLVTGVHLPTGGRHGDGKRAADDSRFRLAVHYDTTVDTE